MKIITTKMMPASNGHYSQCVKYNNTLYLSGQLPINPKNGEIPQSIEEQTDLALSNVRLILNEAGLSKDDIIQTRLYISDIDLWNKVNERYSVFFGKHKPVRSIIPVGKLHLGCLIEIEVIAQIQ